MDRKDSAIYTSLWGQRFIETKMDLYHINGDCDDYKRENIVAVPHDTFVKLTICDSAIHATGKYKLPIEFKEFANGFIKAEVAMWVSFRNRHAREADCG